MMNRTHPGVALGLTLCLLLPAGCKRSSAPAATKPEPTAATTAEPTAAKPTPPAEATSDAKPKAEALPNAPTSTTATRPATTTPLATATGSARTTFQARDDAGGALGAITARLQAWRPDGDGTVLLRAEGRDAPLERWQVTQDGGALLRDVPAWGLRWRLSAEGCRVEPLRWQDGVTPPATGLPCTRRDVRVLTAVGVVVLLADRDGAGARASLRLDRVRTGDDAPLELWLSSASIGARWRVTVRRDGSRIEGIEGHGLMATDRAAAPLQHVSMETRIDGAGAGALVVYVRDHDGEFGGWRAASGAAPAPRPRVMRQAGVDAPTKDAPTKDTAAQDAASGDTPSLIGARFAALTERARAFDAALRSDTAFAAWPRELVLQRDGATAPWLPSALRAPQVGAALQNAPGTREALLPPAPARRLAQLEPSALPAFIGTLATEAGTCLMCQLVGYEDRPRPEEGEGQLAEETARRLRLIVRGCAGP